MDSNQITYPITFALRRGTSAALYEVNEILHQGEPVIETDTLKIKIGDGETPYNGLDYVGASELSDLEIDISKLQEQINAFFANADVSDKAIDTLLEIQKILNDSTIDIQGLLNKVNEFEALHKEIVNTHNTDKAALEAQIDELINACDEAFNEAEVDRAEIRKEFAAADQEIALANTNAINALSGELAEVSATQILNNTNVNERIDRVEEDYKAADEAIIDTYTKAIEDLTKIHNEDKNNLQGVDNQLDSKITTLDNEIKDLTTAIESEIENAKLDRTAIRNEIAEEKADLIKRSQEDHNAIREDIDEVAAGLDKKIDETKTAAANALNEEIERAKAAENTNDLAIKAEVARATEAEKNITDSHVANMEALRKEIQEANTAISNTHTEDIAAVSSEAASDRAKIREELANAKNETQAYADAIKISILGSDKLNETYDTLTEIAAWIENHGVEATDLAGAIAAEASTRDAKDVELTNAIEAEKTARESKDIVIETAIANEITNRQNKEAEIEGHLTDLNNATTTKFTSLDEQLAEMNSKINSLPANELEVVKADLVAHKEEATAKFAEIDESISTATSDRDDIRVEFAAADEEIVKANTTDHTAIRAEFATADAEIVETNTNEHIAINTRIDNNTADHQTIRNEMSDLSATAAGDRALIREQYANADSILQSTCEGENAAIRAEFAAADLQLTTDLGNEIARAEAAEAKALADAKAYTDEVKTNLLGEGILNETYDTLTEIADWIEDHGVEATELAGEIAKEVNTRSAEDSRIEEAFKAADKEINDHLIDTDKKHQEDIQSLGNTINNLGIELRGVDNSINARLNAAIAAHEAEDARIDAAYKAADTALVNDIDTRYGQAVADMTADYIKRDEDIIAYFDEQLGVIMNGSY